MRRFPSANLFYPVFRLTLDTAVNRWATFAPTKTLIENDSAARMISFYTSRIITLVLCRPKIFVHGAGFYF